MQIQISCPKLKDKGRNIDANIVNNIKFSTCHKDFYLWLFFCLIDHDLSGLYSVELK